LDKDDSNPVIFKFKPFFGLFPIVFFFFHQQNSKLVAYFCRKYALEKAMSLKSIPKGPEETKFMGNLLDRLEAEKVTLNLTDGKVFLFEAMAILCCSLYFLAFMRNLRI